MRQPARRSRQVNVVVGCEVRLQPLVAGDVGQDPQLLLRVVGPEQELARGRHEGTADAPAEGGSDRDVLEVRIGARPRIFLRVAERRIVVLDLRRNLGLGAAFGGNA